jgi:hypothetical protein
MVPSFYLIRPSAHPTVRYRTLKSIPTGCARTETVATIVSVRESPAKSTRGGPECSDRVVGPGRPRRTRTQRLGSGSRTGPRGAQPRLAGGCASVVASGDTVSSQGNAAQCCCHSRTHPNRCGKCASRASAVRCPGRRTNRVWPCTPLRRQPRTNPPGAETVARYGARRLPACCASTSREALGDGG